MYIAVAIAFWASLLGLLYAYLGYPILISTLVWLRCPTVAPRHLDQDVTASDQDLPEVTVLITAYNAEQHLQDRIENILACDYPSELVSILVASDGSTDDTAQVVQEFGEDAIQVIEYPYRRGKSATLVDAVSAIASPVIVFTDATTRFDRSSLLHLTRHFSDGRVGLVAGTVRMVDLDGMPSESLYWRVEMMLRRCEAKLGTTMGASGAIYAVRRSMFVAPTKPIINDDLVLPMLLRLNHDCRLVVDKTAFAFVKSGGGFRSEFLRRSRIGFGAFQCLPVLKDLLRWRNRQMAAVFVSHKLLRWLCPFLLVSALVCNAALLNESIYQWTMVAQVFAYTAAIYGLVSRRNGAATRASRVATSFVLMNAALAIGMFRWMANPETVTWNPTSRPNWGPGLRPAQLETNRHQRAA